MALPKEVELRSLITLRKKFVILTGMRTLPSNSEDRGMEVKGRSKSALVATNSNKGLAAEQLGP